MTMPDGPRLAALRGRYVFAYRRCRGAIAIAFVALEGFLLGVAALNACEFPSIIAVGALPIMAAMLAWVGYQALVFIAGGSQ